MDDFKDDFWDILLTPKTKEEQEREEREHQEKITESIRRMTTKYKRYESDNYIDHTIFFHSDKAKYGYADTLALIEIEEHKGVPLDKFMIHRDDETVYPRALYIKRVHTFAGYQNRGIGKKLFEEFGKMYVEQGWEGLPVAVIFNNPICEYAMRKAVDEGSVPSSAWQEKFIDRIYDCHQEQLVAELKARRPEYFPLPAKDYIRMIEIKEKKNQNANR